MTGAYALLAAALGGLLAGCAPPPLTPVDARDPAAPSLEYTRRQEILTALPVRVRLPSRYGADRVFVFYRTWGSSDWGALELARAGQTWKGAISCHDVSTVTGDTHYFFLVVDPQGREVPDSGWRKWQHVVTVVGELPSGPQALDGETEPERCQDPADCPPDFPGCPAYAIQRPACRTSGDCASGMRCDWDGYCSAPEPLASERPRTDEELLASAMRRAVSSSRPRSSGASRSAWSHAAATSSTR